MDRQSTMRLFAKWHIWLGWLVGFPILMWLITGLVMVAKPIEEVRGNHLRQPVVEQALPPETNIAISLPEGDDRPVKSVETAMVGTAPVTTFTYMDGAIERYGADGKLLEPISEDRARQIAAERIIGGENVTSAARFDADNVPFDFRRPMPVWQIALEDGTHVYIAEQTGEIAAVRTRWWRIFDFMWGLHIMDLQEREDTSHPILIFFAAIAALGALLGCILMFRRRKTRARTA